MPSNREWGSPLYACICAIVLIAVNYACEYAIHCRDLPARMAEVKPKSPSRTSTPGYDQNGTGSGGDGTLNQGGGAPGGSGGAGSNPARGGVPAGGGPQGGNPNTNGQIVLVIARQCNPKITEKSSAHPTPE